jgi:hypothetical protein
MDHHFLLYLHSWQDQLVTMDKVRLFLRLSSNTSRKRMRKVMLGLLDMSQHLRFLSRANSRSGLSRKRLRRLHPQP